MQQHKFPLELLLTSTGNNSLSSGRSDVGPVVRTVVDEQDISANTPACSSTDVVNVENFG
jgi:hypothetical protein